MKLFLIDSSMVMVTYWKQAFVGTDVECACDDFATFMSQRGDEIETVVSPANSYGILSGGFDLALKQYFGETLQRAVQDYIRENYHGEQPVGTSFLIPIPNTPGKSLIHTPTMRIPSPIYDSMVVYHAMRTTLLEALRHNVRSIVIPAFGGKCGQVSKDIIARMMRLAYDQVFSDVPEKVTWEYALRGMQTGQMPEQLRPPLPELSDKNINP